jgi:heme peroxidase
MPQAERPHGVGVRGLTLAPKSALFAGPFGRIFRYLPAADFGDDDDQSQAALTQLGDAMGADRDNPKDGPDAEESGIPAAYTYLGQFIDHDLTFDPASSLQRQNDPDALVDFRTPRFDLDSVYGRGPNDQPYLYSDGRLFLLGNALNGAALGNAFTASDLPRSGAKAQNPAAQARAIIGDPRNDENVIVSQLQGLFLRFHNRLATDNPQLGFEAVQREVRFHYQWMVLHDFLPTIVSHHVLRQVIPHLTNGTNVRLEPPKLEFYHPRDDLFMPLEFSAAAYRFGHSMIRPGYRLNDAIGPLPIFPFIAPPTFDPGLTGFDQFPAEWAIDWGRFIDLDVRPFGDENNAADPGNPQRTQLAYRIDTSVVNPLTHLPARVASDPPPSLASRNLLRGWRMRLPSGQNVARAMGIPPLADADILIGKFTGEAGDIKGDVVAVGGANFKDNCPLWTYILAETEEVTRTFKTSDGDKQIKTRQLGRVGGRIVAETIVGILAGDRSSFLNQNPLWKPSLAVDGAFGLREFIAAARQG